MKRSDLALLIREIDEVIDSAGQLSFQTLYQQQLIQLLIKAKEGLVELRQSQKSDNLEEVQAAHEESASNLQGGELDQAIAAITEAVTAQIRAEKTDRLTSLEAELSSLRQQKQDLLQEINALEQQKKHLIGDFLQVLMERFSDRLQQQVSWTCEQIIDQQTNLDSKSISKSNNVGLEASSMGSVWQSLQQLESYHQSLAEGLERIYNLAQQNKVNLIQQIDRIAAKLEQANQLDGPQTPQDYSIIPATSGTPPTDLEQADTIITEGATPIKAATLASEYLQKTLLQLQGIVQTQADQSQIPSGLVEQPPAVTAKSPSVDEPVAAIGSLLDLIDHSNLPAHSDQQSIWYLGIDFGTSKIAAVLTQAKLDANNQLQLQQYPIYWLDRSQNEYPSPTLATTVYISNGETSDDSTKEVLLENFKPYLNIAIPYYEPDQQRWEPLLGNQQSISLNQIQFGLTSLLQRFKATSGLIAQAKGLSAQELQGAMENLEAVIVSCPSQSQATYSLNLREAVLKAGLHKNPAQIFCLPEATASLINAINTHPLESGLTLVIHIGAANTELALVDIPPQAEIDAANIKLHTYKYGGNEIDLDIFCNLIYPQWRTQLKTTLSQLENYKPQAGSSDRARRNLTDLYLQNSTLGSSCLSAARLSKIILQQQASFTAYLHNQPWTLTKTNFNRQIIIPFIHELQQQIQFLCQSTQAGELSQSKTDLTTTQSIATSDITQVVCSGGGVACMWGVMSDWLSKFLSNAKIICDNPNDPTIQPVARGLGYLPLFPQTLDLSKHRWNDYFLLYELLQAFPPHSFDRVEIMELLEARGIDTSICAERILLLLDGELPPGLIPIDTAYDWLTPTSANNPRYQELLAEPLFQKENDRYRPNYQQCLRIRQYLELIASSTQLQFSKPLLGNIALTAKFE